MAQDSLHAAWLDAHEERGPGAHEDGFGLRPSDDARSPAGYAVWVRGLLDQADQAKAAAVGRVLRTFRWIVEDSRALGGIALRHGLNEQVLRPGHIGYGIRPSARRRGLATGALGRMPDEARAPGLDRVLLVCEEGNTASTKTIERLGGALEGIRDIRLWQCSAVLDHALKGGQVEFTDEYTPLSVFYAADRTCRLRPNRDPAVPAGRQGGQNSAPLTPEG